MITIRSDTASQRYLDEDSYRSRIEFMAKLSVSLPDDLARDLQQIARGNISAFVAEAVRAELDRRRLYTLVQELEDQVGPVDEAEVARYSAMLAEANAAARASEGGGL
jgi:hypothetical protein